MHQDVPLHTDFIAILHYLPTEKGGRSTLALSGYRPQVKFPFSDQQTSGQQHFLNKEKVHPGETVTAAIRIISVEYFAGKLFKGLTFEFLEGSRLIGTGTITEIINEQLRKK